MPVAWALFCALVTTFILAWLNEKVLFTEYWFIPSLIEFLNLHFVWGAKVALWFFITLIYCLTGLHTLICKILFYIVGAIGAICKFLLVILAIGLVIYLMMGFF